MKKVLSLLVAYVFFQTQSWALVGGPVYPGGNLSLIGTYAGVLIPDSPQTGTSLSGKALAPTVTSIGLFTLSVPSLGLASGTTVFFVNGDPYTGTISGVADPDKSTLVGIVKTTSDFFFTDTAFPGQQFFIFATGNIQADIFSNSTVQTGGQTSTSTRILGTSTVSVSGGGPGYDGAFTYIVDGFKQDSTSSTATGG